MTTILNDYILRALGRNEANVTVCQTTCDANEAMRWNQSSMSTSRAAGRVSLTLALTTSKPRGL